MLTTRATARLDDRSGCGRGVFRRGGAPENIVLRLNDTNIAPNGGPSGGSRSQVVIGNAIKKGCDQRQHQDRQDYGRGHDGVGRGYPVSMEYNKH